MISLLNLTQCTERFKKITGLNSVLNLAEVFAIPLDPEVIYPNLPIKHISFSRIVAVVNFDSLAGGLLESLLAISAYPFTVLQEVKVVPMIGGLVVTYQFKVYANE